VLIGAFWVLSIAIDTHVFNELQALIVMAWKRSSLRFQLISGALQHANMRPDELMPLSIGLRAYPVIAEICDCAKETIL
jgi:hypothetical protein